jgi:hypothetical protein
LTVTAAPQLVATAGLTGRAGLTVQTVPGFTAPAPLTGAGGLTVVTEASPEYAGTANLTGSGALAVMEAPALAVAADLTGAGVLTASTYLGTLTNHDVRITLDPHTTTTLTPTARNIRLAPKRSGTDINPHIN